MIPIESRPVVYTPFDQGSFEDFELATVRGQCLLYMLLSTCARRYLTSPKRECPKVENDEKYELVKI